MLVSWSQVLCTVPHNTQIDRCYLLVVFKPAKASCHSPAAATPGCPTSLGISSHSRDGRVATDGGVAAHGGFAPYGCALPSNRVTEVGCWGAFVKVEGFSQAMEFEEHRGTVYILQLICLASYVGEVGDLWIWCITLGITLFLIPLNPPAESWGYHSNLSSLPDVLPWRLPGWPPQIPGQMPPAQMQQMYVRDP